MKLERRAAFELRAEGRKVVGPALRFADVSPSHRERFEPGAFALDASRTYWLDREHNPEIVLAHTGAGLEMRAEDDGLYIEADLPPIPAADRALEDIRAGILKGLSVEFYALEERQEADLRVISRADLVGIGLVKHPGYEQSTVEVRDAGLVVPMWALS